MTSLPLILKDEDILPLTPVLRPVVTLSGISEWEEMDYSSSTGGGKPKNLGTFVGVFVPTCEFMWSVLLFVRFGYIVGQAGILVAGWIILLCMLTIGLTASSLSAIATNGIPSAGVYHILEKSLGRGLGGGIALLYYAGVTLLVSIEIVGSVQGFLLAIKWHENDEMFRSMVSTVILIICSLLVCTGHKFMHGIAVVFLFVLVGSFTSMIIGLAVLPTDSPYRINNPQLNLFPHQSFAFNNCLSLILPCFIGIFSGVNNAKSLRKPYRSVPFGTFAAVGVSTFLYLILVLLFGLQIDRNVLLENLMVGPLSAWPSKWIAVLGVLIVGLGASCQCLMMASSVLHSLAEDEVLLLLNKLRIHKLQSNEPRLALLLTTILSFPLMFINVEMLAEWTTMCFLLCYCCTNWACWLLSTFKSPNWRPKFEYNGWCTAALGFLLCLGLMFSIQWYYALISVFLAISLAYIIQTSSASLSWGQGLHGLIFHIMVRYLVDVEQQDFRMKLQSYFGETRNLQSATFGISSDIPRDAIGANVPIKWSGRVWRPQIVCFTSMYERGGGITHPRLISLIAQMTMRSSLCILVNVLAKDEEILRINRAARKRKRIERGNMVSAETVADASEVSYSERREMIDEVLLERKLILHQTMIDEGILGFAKVMSAPSVRVGQRIFLQTMGLGELTPNTVVISWPDAPHTKTKDLLHIEEVWQLSRRVDLSCLIVKGLSTFPKQNEELSGRLDVWWIVQEGQLLLMLAYLLKQHNVWRGCELCLYVICHITDDIDEIKHELDIYLNLMRIMVDHVTVVPLELVKPVEDIFQDSSHFSKLRGSWVAHQLSKEIFHEQLSRTEQPGSRIHKRTRTNTEPSSSKFPYFADNILFMNSEVIQQLKQAITSSSSESQLVLYNLPAPVESAELSTQHSLYMDLIQWLTEEIPRSVLVSSAPGVTVQ